MNIIKSDIVLERYNRFKDINPGLRIDRNIIARDIAINMINNDSVLSDLLENNIKAKTVFSDNILNPRMFFALRNAETGTNRVEFYCMGANYCDLEYNPQSNDYTIDFNDTYKEKEKGNRLSEIQNVFVIRQSKSNHEKYYGSYLYSLNPLCEARDSDNVFLIDAEAGFTREGITGRCFMDLVFLVVNDGIANLLFIESKRADNTGNTRKNEYGNHSETVKQIYEYGRVLERDSDNVLDQYNHIIKFYNEGFGCKLPLLDKEKSRIKLGLCVFRQNTDRGKRLSDNVTNEAKALGCLTCDVIINEASYAKKDQIDGGFEERVINSILNMAKAFAR